MNNRCLYCYKELAEGEKDFHPRCATELFGTTTAPQLNYSTNKIKELAEQVIRTHSAVTGVQAKLSLDIERGEGNDTQRFTIVGLWGSYILKPQSADFRSLPEVEDLTMHLAQIAKVATVPHSLIRFSDGELCYLTKRIDRGGNGEKYAMEDMCQLTERLTEYKYKGSYEQIAKVIDGYSTLPQQNKVHFWEQVLFSWITGNSDMHLKNFSLYSIHHGEYALTPAYDLVSTKLVMPEDSEELALTLNGKKRKIVRVDFVVAMQRSGLQESVIEKIFDKFLKVVPHWIEMINISFLPNDMKVEYQNLIMAQISKLEGNH